MNLRPLQIAAVLLACAICPSANTQSFTLDAADATYRYDAAARLLHVHCDGNRALVAAPAPLVPTGGEEPVALPDSAVSLRDAHESDAGNVYTYAAQHDGKALSFNIELRPENESLLIRIFSNSAEWEGVAPATLLGDASWRRLDLSQYGLAHGQPSYQKATYSTEHELWLWAFWRLEAGSCSLWRQEYPQNQGTGPLELAPRAVYSTNTSGRRMELDETLELRVAPRLWQAVPPSANQPSLHREELAQSVFVDLWGAGPAADTQYLLKTLAQIAGDRVSFYTVLQNWQAGGFDSLLPDSIQMPDYPPNPGIGTVEELAELSRTGTSMGRFAFRTNYQLLRDHSPSRLTGEARPALNADGTPKWHTKPADLLHLAQRQETEIQALFAPNATFTDQLASGGPPSSYLDYDAQMEEGTTMRATVRLQRQFAESLHQFHGGPVGSETLNAEYLLGRWVDTADFGLMGGHHRLITPEYKLRRLHTLTTVHGMGLPYRFCELPPFKDFHRGRSTWEKTASLDDYRCAEILFGNGGYLYMPGTPWEYVLTECLLVGQLQKHYALQPVREVHYWAEGSWVTLETLVEDGFAMHTRPFGEQSAEFARIRIEYENGLRVIVNRSEEPFSVSAAGQEFTLPKAGWIAWGNEVLAYSAHAPGTIHRVDFLDDRRSGVRYLDPRGREMHGVTTATLWDRRGDSYKASLQANEDGTTIDVAGRRIPLEPPKPAPLTKLDIPFAESLEGWRAVAGVRRAEVTPEGWRLWIADPDPQLYSPALRIAADKVTRIALRLRVDEGALADGTIGQLYFTTENDPRISEDQVFRFPLGAVGAWQTVELDTTAHPRWRGQVITGLRLDPVHGLQNTVVTLAEFRGIMKASELHG